MYNIAVTSELKKAHDHDAGYDLVYGGEESVVINPGEHYLMETTITNIAIPPGVVGFVNPRSGLSAREGVTVLNAPGTIDAGFRNTVMVNLVNHSDKPYEVTPGERIAQIVFIELAETIIRVKEETDPVFHPNDQRGSGGHGSSGTH